MRKYIITFAGILAVLLVVDFAHFSCYCHNNEKLRVELLREFEAWNAAIPQVPDNENGAVPIRKGARACSGVPKFMQNFSQYPFDPQCSTEVQMVEMWVNSNNLTSDLFDKGLAFEKWRYLTDFSTASWQTYYIDLDNIMDVCSFLTLQDIKCALALSHDNTSEAVDEALKLVQLGGTLKDERTLLSTMVQSALLQVGLKSLVKVLDHDAVTEKDCIRIIDALPAYSSSMRDFLDILEDEYTLGAKMTADVIGDPNAWKSLNYWPRDKQMSSSLFCTMKYVFDQRLILNAWRFYIRTIKDTVEKKGLLGLKDLSDNDILEKSGLDLQLSDPESYGLSYNVVNPNLTKCADYWVRLKANLNGTTILAAMKLFQLRNGRLPEKLADLKGMLPPEMLIDPYTGKRFVYRVEGKDFYLYSLGSNQKDDGGDPREPQGKPDPAQGQWEGKRDIVIHRPPQPEKKTDYEPEKKTYDEYDEW